MSAKSDLNFGSILTEYLSGLASVSVASSTAITNCTGFAVVAVPGAFGVASSAAAVGVVFAFAGIYAAKVFAFPQDKVIMFAIAVNIFCGIGAIAGGIIEDRIGAFKTVRLSLFCLLLLLGKV